MNDFSWLNETSIRSYATAKSWQRGEDYYLSGHVTSIAKRGDTVEASVEGSHYQPYRVNISWQNQELHTFFCTCPYDYEGICKHQVATLLVCLREPHKLKSHPTIEQLLDRLSEIQTQTLIQKLVERKPELIAEIEKICDRIAPPAVVNTPAESDSREITIDANKVRSQVRRIIENARNVFEYGDYYEEETAIPEIEELVSDAYDFNNNEEHWNAITILTAITDACVENWHLIDDYGMDYNEIASSLNRAWSEVILSTPDISPADKTDLEVQFEFWRQPMGRLFCNGRDSPRTRVGLSTSTTGFTG